jgi:hypothetical protein
MKLVLLTVAFLALCCAPNTFGQESRVKRADLPAAVRATVDRESAGATIKGYSKERENGKTAYEVELVANGMTRDIMMDASGNVLEVEQQVTFESLPSPVQSALKAAAGKGTIGVIESLTKNGNLVAYEAHIKGGRTREVQVGPNGEKLTRKE